MFIYKESRMLFHELSDSTFQRISCLVCRFEVCFYDE
jgi:hypothetical protein